jgi:hypothetical protein
LITFVRLLCVDRLSLELDRRDCRSDLRVILGSGEALLTSRDVNRDGKVMRWA